MAKQLNRIRNRLVSKDELAGDLKSISGLSNEDAFKQINQIAAEVNRFYKKQKINKLKGITGLNWVINTSSSDKETYLMSDNNKIFHINNNIVEVYRAGLGAQLNRIKLGDNVERIVDVSVEDKNLMILIVRL